MTPVILYKIMYRSCITEFIHVKVCTDFTCIFGHTTDAIILRFNKDWVTPSYFGSKNIKQKKPLRVRRGLYKHTQFVYSVSNLKMIGCFL